MVQDGDRHHRAQSARPENEEKVDGDPDNHVVMKFVLDYHIHEFGSRLPAQRPLDDLSEGHKVPNFRE